MQGVELVNRLLLGEPESTIGIKYESTLDGRNAARHEPSVHAGSGDPKKAAERAALAAAAAGSSTTPTSATAASVIGQLKQLNPDQPGDKREAHVSEEELGVTTAPDHDAKTNPANH
jgi:hypothetical protein